jgi:hypothetical protein
VSVVRPEYGPTLPELLAPRLRALGRRGRLVVGAGAVLLAAAVVTVLLLRGGDGRRGIVVERPVAFNLLVPASLHRIAPQRGEALRLRTASGAADPQSLSVRPLRLARYRGDVSATLALLSVRLIDEMRRQVPGFVWRGDGRARINDAPGYQIVYQATIAGRTTYGRRVLLFPDAGDGPPVREGLDVDARAARSQAVPRVDDVGRNGALKLPLTSLRFGRERP